MLIMRQLNVNNAEFTRLLILRILKIDILYYKHSNNTQYTTLSCLLAIAWEQYNDIKTRYKTENFTHQRPHAASVAAAVPQNIGQLISNWVGSFL